jgi:hypothetical protein
LAAAAWQGQLGGGSLAAAAWQTYRQLDLIIKIGVYFIYNLGQNTDYI